MADTTIVLSAKEFITAGLLGTGGFFMWLLKRSIYGRMDAQDKVIADLQTKPMCSMMQKACQGLLIEKMDAVAIISSKEVEAIDKKLDTVLTNIAGLSTRIDKHLNGHKGE